MEVGEDGEYLDAMRKTNIKGALAGIEVVPLKDSRWSSKTATTRARLPLQIWWLNVGLDRQWMVFRHTYDNQLLWSRRQRTATSTSTKTRQAGAATVGEACHIWKMARTEVHGSVELPEQGI